MEAKRRYGIIPIFCTSKQEGSEEKYCIISTKIIQFLSSHKDYLIHNIVTVLYT
jgi:hypothetical protein